VYEPQPAPSHWSAFDELAGTDIGEALRSGMSAEVAAALKPALGQYEAAINALGNMLEATLESLALADLREQMPPGLDLGQEANLAKLRETADMLLMARDQSGRARFDPVRYNRRHATAQALALAFPSEVARAEAERLARSQRRALRSSPDASDAPARSAQAPSPEEAEDAAAEAILAGRGRDGAESAFRARAGRP
jgi:hypothetical protein